jgi:hypothetical protein
MTKEEINSINDIIDNLVKEYSKNFICLEVAKIQNDAAAITDLSFRDTKIHNKIVNLLKVIYE